MRSKGNPYHFKHVLPRMSWHPNNVYNMHRRFIGPHGRELDWTSSNKTLFQQRWLARKVVRAYHGDHIKEAQFKKWYLPETLPDVRPNRANWPAEFGESGNLAVDRKLLQRYAQRDVKKDDQEEKDDRSEEEILREHLEHLALNDTKNLAKKGLAPVGSLMFSEVERRLDVLIFRACFAENVWEARRLIVHGHVKINGQEVRNSNTRLAPGDMVTVNPETIRLVSDATAEEEDLHREHQLWEASIEESPNSIEPHYRWDHVLERLPKSFEGNSKRLLETAKLTAKLKRPSKGPKKAVHGLQPGDIPPVTPFRVPFYSGPNLFIPAYLEVSFNVCSFIYVRHPTARPGYSEVPTPYDADGEVVRSAWDWYSARRPRVTSKRKISRMPVDRNFVRKDDDKYVRRQLAFNERVKKEVEEMKARGRREVVQAWEDVDKFKIRGRVAPRERKAWAAFLRAKELKKRKSLQKVSKGSNVSELHLHQTPTTSSPQINTSI